MVPSPNFNPKLPRPAETVQKTLVDLDPVQHAHVKRHTGSDSLDDELIGVQRDLCI